MYFTIRCIDISSVTLAFNQMQITCTLVWNWLSCQTDAYVTITSNERRPRSQSAPFIPITSDFECRHSSPNGCFRQSVTQELKRFEIKR